MELTPEQIKGWRKHPGRFKFVDGKFYTFCRGCGVDIPLQLNDGNDPKQGDASAECTFCNYYVEYDKDGEMSFSFA
jgi:hypothetical protein